MSETTQGTLTPLTPNIVSIVRILLTFVTVVFFTFDVTFAIIAFFMTIMVIYMDSLDGYLARKFRVASEFGALLDIAGDRIVENTFWIFFAAHDDVSFWVPVVIVTRGFLVDMVRGIALSEGKTPFGSKTMMRSRVTRFLVSSRFSRAIYGVSKLLAFCWLGGFIALTKGIDADYWHLSDTILSLFRLISQILAYTVLTFCVIRGVPVLWDGREYVLTKRYPKQMKNEF